MKECKCTYCKKRQLNKVKAAVETLKQAFQDDPDFAYGWHCNIAMMCYDAIRAAESMDPDPLAHEDAHEVGNDAASRFMKLAFDVETKLQE